MNLTIFLSGEIHSDWREELVNGIADRKLPIEVISPITDHDASDNIGVEALGPEDSNFWKDHKAAKINSMRIGLGIDRADIVVVKFGEKYKQWNAAFDAGYAIAKGKKLIVIHAPEHTHPLKEVNAQAMATAENQQQVLDVLEYVSTKK